MKRLLVWALLIPAAGAAAQDTTLVPLSADMAVTTNADNGAEVVVALPNYIAHVWESTPGGASSFPWNHYTPGGSNVVMGRDANGRILIAWLAKGQLMLMTEPHPRSSLEGPTVLVGGLNLKELRLGRRPTDGSLILVALTGKGTVIARRQQLANLWEFTGEDDLAGHDLTSVAVAVTGDGRFAVVATGKDKQVYWRREATPHGAWIDWSGLQGHDIRTTEVATDANGRLQVVALGGDKRLYFTRQDANGNFPDWGSVSVTLAGTAFRVGASGSGALILWGNAPGMQQCSGSHCSASEWIPPNPVFSEAGPNGVWTNGGTGAPGARVVTAANTVIDADPVNKVITETTITTTPGNKGSGPTCGPTGVSVTDGTPCVPASGPTTTTSTHVISSTYQMMLVRNGTSTVLTTQSP